MRDQHQLGRCHCKTKGDGDQDLWRHSSLQLFHSTAGKPVASSYLKDLPGWSSDWLIPETLEMPQDAGQQIMLGGAKCVVIMERVGRMFALSVVGCSCFWRWSHRYTRHCSCGSIRAMLTQQRKASPLKFTPEMKGGHASLLSWEHYLLHFLKQSTVRAQ